MARATVLTVSLFLLVSCSGAPATTVSPRVAETASPAASPSEEPKIDNKALIRKAWKNYSEAVVFRDAKDAIESVHHWTLDHFDKIRFAASNAGPEQILKMPLADRLMIGALRLRYKPDRLLKMDSQDILRFCLEEGMAGLRLKTSKMELVKVKVDDEDGLGFGTFTVKGTKARLRMDFRREGGEWKIDFLPIIRYGSSYLIEFARDEGLDPDEMILRLLEIQSGRPVDAGVWTLPES